jgi:DNA helicase HerA-like ATPase
VDPYSNTIFNSRQMRQLLVEVERLLEVPLSGDERESLEAVADLCREGRRVHRFLWFIGD